MMADRLARLRLDRKCAYSHQGFNPAYMTTTLQERMSELMTAKGWTVGEIARIAGVTSAAVSQWVGNGTGKQSKSIGNAEAAVRLEKASGFSWMWLAQGKGPKLAAIDAPIEPKQLSTQAERLADALQVLTNALQKADRITRKSLEPLLAELASNPENAAENSRFIIKCLVTNDDLTSSDDDENRSHTRHGTLLGASSQELGGKGIEQRDSHAATGGGKG